MKRLKEFLEKEDRGYYEGSPLEAGKTSIVGDAAPPIRRLSQKVFKEGQKILDYGAGRIGRNSTFLREKGCNVYAFDPFHGTEESGWNGISMLKPEDTDFDYVFTCYVLNVVPLYVEKEILKDCNQYSKNQFHIVRNKEVFDSVKDALNRKDKIVSEFFKREFATDQELEMFNRGELDDDTIMEFCKYGVQTSAGFQRICELEKHDQNMKLINENYKFKVYRKGE